MKLKLLNILNTLVFLIFKIRKTMFPRKIAIILKTLSKIADNNTIKRLKENDIIKITKIF